MIIFFLEFLETLFMLLLRRGETQKTERQEHSNIKETKKKK